MAARCFCHELEHLEGHMYDEHTDRLYTAEELDEILSSEEKEGKKLRRGRRKR
jgi:peptide deformylase